MTAPIGKIVIVCTATGHDREEIVRVIRWAGQGGAFSFTATGDRDDRAPRGRELRLSGSAVNGSNRTRTRFRCEVCGDCVEVQAGGLDSILQRLSGAGVSKLSLTGLRGIL